MEVGGGHGVRANLKETVASPKNRKLFSTFFGFGKDCCHLLDFAYDFCCFLYFCVSVKDWAAYEKNKHLSLMNRGFAGGGGLGIHILDTIGGWRRDPLLIYISSFPFLFSLFSLFSRPGPPQKKNKIGEKSALADFSPIFFFF